MKIRTCLVKLSRRRTLRWQNPQANKPSFWPHSYRTCRRKLCSLFSKFAITIKKLKYYGLTVESHLLSTAIRPKLAGPHDDTTSKDGGPHDDTTSKDDKNEWVEL
ncbi:hypothetical protein J6590_002410 [Homalodisca vitripennis]|nr:hypothetical protein J6590_002410 [Homalodisca vitripennis]